MLLKLAGTPFLPPFKNICSHKAVWKNLTGGGHVFVPNPGRQGKHLLSNLCVPSEGRGQIKPPGPPGLPALTSVSSQFIEISFPCAGGWWGGGGGGGGSSGRGQARPRVLTEPAQVLGPGGHSRPTSPRFTVGLKKIGIRWRRGAPSRHDA